MGEEGNATEGGREGGSASRGGAPRGSTHLHLRSAANASHGAANGAICDAANAICHCECCTHSVNFYDVHGDAHGSPHAAGDDGLPTGFVCGDANPRVKGRVATTLST